MDRKRKKTNGHLQIFRIQIVVLLVSILSGCASSRQAQTSTLSKSEMESLVIQQQTDEEYIIQPGDQIEIAVWGYEEFNTTKTVNSQNIITVPLAGEIRAGGISKEKFKDSLRDHLSEYIKGDINFSVTITSAQNNTVSVLGSVGRPDNYQIINTTSLFEILSKAGGTTEQADLRSIRIYQQGDAQEPVEVNLADYLKRKQSGPVAVVHPGDIVYVPQQENVMQELSGFFRDVVLLFGMFRVFN